MAWCPHLQKDTDNVKKVQGRATRMMLEISSLSYDKGLYECGILSLVMRELRLDLILVFNIMKGFVIVEADKFFQFLEDPRTRGHNLQVFKQTCRLNIRKYTFSPRVITEWNPLSPEAVTAKTVNLLKGVICPLSSKLWGYIQAKDGCLPQFLCPISCC